MLTCDFRFISYPCSIDAIKATTKTQQWKSSKFYLTVHLSTLVMNVDKNAAIVLNKAYTTELLSCNKGAVPTFFFSTLKTYFTAKILVFKNSSPEQTFFIHKIMLRLTIVHGTPRK